MDRILKYSKGIEKTIKSEFYILGLDSSCNVHIFWQGNNIKECKDYFDFLKATNIGKGIQFAWYQSKEKYSGIPDFNMFDSDKLADYAIRILNRMCGEIDEYEFTIILDALYKLKKYEDSGVGLV